MSWGAPVSAPTNPNNDFQVANPPSDGISSVEWSPMGNFLVATAWDGDVRVCVMRASRGVCVWFGLVNEDARESRGEGASEREFGSRRVRARERERVRERLTECDCL